VLLDVAKRVLRMDRRRRGPATAALGTVWLGHFFIASVVKKWFLPFKASLFFKIIFNRT
jgi:hypothetical protein